MQPNTFATSNTRSVGAIAAGTALALALASGSAALLSALGHRAGWWDYQTGLAMLRFAAWGGVATVAVALFAVFVTTRGKTRRGLGLSLLAALMGAAVFGVPWSIREHARGLPSIHDITTDTENPPRFVAVLPLRKDAPNSAEYGGPEDAAKQAGAYPDIVPLVLDLPPASAYERALAGARAAGWQIVAAVPQEGRIEATAETLLFGFKDDVVIRVVEYRGGSRIDVRSVSRVGRGDLGTNAKRIRDYISSIRIGRL
jgi:uncharacterized protein (DUF1499 family)